MSDVKNLFTNNSQSGAVREIEILGFSLVGEYILLFQQGVNFSRQGIPVGL